MPNWPSEPPASNPLVVLQYFVYSKDPADTEALRATYGSYGIRHSPAAVRDILSIAENAVPFTDARWFRFPYPPRMIAINVGTGMWDPPLPVQGTVVYPSDNSGDPYWWPALSVTYDYNQDWFIVPGHPSVPIWGAGVDVTYMWSATFIAAAGNDSVDPPVGPTWSSIMKRRFISGYEMPIDSSSESPEGDGAGASGYYSRDASRTPDGIGIALRSQNSTFIRLLNRYGAITDQHKSWERMYIRLRKAPTTGNHQFWRCKENLSAAGGVSLRVNSTSNLELYTVTTGSVATLRGSSPLVLNRWYKLDILIRYESGGATGVVFHLYLNGVQVLTGTGSIGASNALHSQTIIGNDMTGANDMEIDIDYGHNAEHPSDASNVLDLNRKDWVFGSHCQLIRATQFGSGHSANWTGNFRTLRQNPFTNANGSLTSSTSGARLEADMELDGTGQGPIELIKQLGPAAFLVGIASSNAGGTNGNLGYKIGAAADVLTSIDEGVGMASNSILANVSAGAIDPAVIEPLKAVFTKSADVNATVVRELQIVVELLGSWGSEDDGSANAPGITSMIGIHNAPFFNSFLGRASPPPLNTIAVAGGTHVGNSTGQDIVVEMPAIHWLFIRNITGTGGFVWWSSLISSHIGIGGTDTPDMVSVEAQNDGTTIIRLNGANANFNLAANTYQYIAFCDVASRAVLNGAFRHNNGITSIANNLFDSAFTPEGTFFFEENNGAGVTGMWYKGPGHAVDGGSKVDVTQTTTDVATLAAGVITSRTNLHSSGATKTQIGYSAWRTDDGTGAKPVYIGQYTGNGAGGTRGITVDLRGRRPLWAIVTPMNGASWVRDPSHSGGSSSNAARTSSDTIHIVGGGINLVNVGTGLNANLIVYSIFVMPGGTTAGNDGWSINGVYGLGEIGWTTPYPVWLLTPPPLPADVDVTGSGGIVLSGAPALSLLLNVSGIYSIIPGQRHDVLLDRQSGQTSVNVPIPNPFAKTGYVGG